MSLGVVRAASVNIKAQCNCGWEYHGSAFQQPFGDYPDGTTISALSHRMACVRCGKAGDVWISSDAWEARSH
jgi:hypothetical protein